MNVFNSGASRYACTSNASANTLPRNFTHAYGHRVNQSPTRRFSRPFCEKPENKSLMVLNGLMKPFDPLKWQPKNVQRAIAPNEKPVTQGVQTTQTGPLNLKDDEVYIWIIDDQQRLVYSLENSPHAERKVTHPMLLADRNRKALCGGELQMRKGVLEANTKSASFSADMTKEKRATVMEVFDNMRKDEVYRTPFAVEFHKNLPVPNAEQPAPTVSPDAPGQVDKPDTQELLLNPRPSC